MKNLLLLSIVCALFSIAGCATSADETGGSANAGSSGSAGNGPSGGAGAKGAGGWPGSGGTSVSSGGDAGFGGSSGAGGDAGFPSDGGAAGSAGSAGAPGTGGGGDGGNGTGGAGSGGTGSGGAGSGGAGGGGSGGTAAISCNLSPSSPKGTLIKCTMQHQEFKGIGGVPNGTVTRVFGVFIPKNYVPKQSGMILKIQGTTHQIGNDCQTGPAVSELAGWLPFLQTVPSPAPVMVCPEGWFDTGGTDNGERFNTWGFHSFNWVNGVLPNDVDFLAKIVPAVQSALQLDPKFMAVTNDWYLLGSVMASQFAALHPELVSAVALYNDPTFILIKGSMSGTLTDTDGTTIAPPKGPVHYLNVASGSLQGTNAICGKNTNHLLNTDDIVTY
jgi:hypothetical protein